MHEGGLQGKGSDHKLSDSNVTKGDIGMNKAPLPSCLSRDLVPRALGQASDSPSWTERQKGLLKAFTPGANFAPIFLTATFI